MLKQRQFLIQIFKLKLLSLFFSVVVVVQFSACKLWFWKNLLTFCAIILVLRKDLQIKSKMVEILLGLGLLELSSYHLVKKEELNGQNGQEKIEIENSKTDFKYLRPNLLIPCLRMFSENKDNEYPQKVFEIGTIFKKDNSGKSESGINEESHLLIASSPENFTGIKQMLDYFLRVISIDYKIKESNNEYCIEGRTGSIIINNKEIGFVGEAHPQTLQKWNIKMPLSILEINLTEIINALNNLK